MKKHLLFKFLLTLFLFVSWQISYGQANVIITEVTDASTYTAEFVELYNAGDAAQDLLDWSLNQYGSSQTTTFSSSITTNMTGNYTLNPGEYVVVFRGTLTNFQTDYPGYSGYYITTNNSSSGAPQMNGGESYELVNSSATVVDRMGTDPTSVTSSAKTYERKDALSTGADISTDWVELDRSAATPGAANATTLLNDLNAGDTPPQATFDPADGASDILIGSNITITFDELIYKSDGTTEIVDADLPALITITEGGVEVADGNFTMTYDNSDPFVITINPNSDLSLDEEYNVAFGSVYDDAQQENSGENATFHTELGYIPIVSAYSISDDAIEITYESSMTSVDPADYNLTGTTAITFSGATIDGTDDKIVHLSGASATIDGDATLDNIADANSGVDFYAGITPIAYTNLTNPGGTLTDGITATFTGIISANDEYNGLWISDDEGAYNGVYIYSSSFVSEVAVGDSVLITANVDHYNNLTELVDPVLIEQVSTANTPYAPSIITGSTIEETITADTDPAEKWEGQLIQIVNANVTVDKDGSDYYYTASDDAGTTSFRIGDNVDFRLYNITLTVGDDVTITGVCDYEDGAYRINPRSTSDILSATDTVGSIIYTVDQGLMKISDIPFSTELADFKSNIEAADSATFNVFDDLGGTTPATVLDNSKYLIVTAADGLTKDTYTIEKNAALTDATVTSSTYTVVDGTPGTISNIPFGTDLATFKSNITAPEYGTFEVYVSDGGAVATDLQDGYFLTGVAEDGTTEADYNIEVSSVVPDTDSDVTAPTTQVPAATVAVVDGDETTEAFNVFSFDINDAGTADGLPTNVSQIVLYYGSNMTLDLNTDDIADGWVVIDGTDEVAFASDPIIGGDSIAFAFNEGDITVPDNGSINVTLQVVLDPNAADGSVIQFMIPTTDHGFETTGISSEFNATFTSEVTGNNITIDVVATELNFSTEPTDVYVDANIDPAVVVEAVDANGNIDTDYVTDIAITATGATLTGAVSETPVAGVATFSTISFTDEGTGVTLTASSGTLTDGTSAAFNVTVEPEKDLFFSEYVEGSSNGNNRALEIYNPTTSEIDLSSYSIKQSYNGAGWGMREVDGTPTAMSEYVLPLSGTLGAGEVYVIYNSQADESITSVGDLALSYGDGCDGCRNASFTGDDPMGLFKDDVLIDAVGIELEQGPWNVGDTTDATKDHTLIRKTGTTIGNTDWASSAGTNNDNSEWIIKSADYTSDLGCYGPKSGTDILTYSFDLQTGPADIDDVNHTVDIEVAFGTSVTALVAEFTLSDGASATVGSTDQISGTTANDFSAPVTYTITAEDGSTQDWIVTVTVATTQSSEKEITSFTVDGIIGSAIITSGDATVDATVEYGTDITSLKPTFEISNLATFVTDTSVAKDFTNAQDYIVEAEDGTQKTWTVTIAEEAPTDVSDIASLRALYSETNETLYRITGEVTFTYATAPYFYIQDATAAILIYDHATYGVISTAYSIGDNVQNLVGVFDTFGENMQFALVEDPGAAVSTGNTVDAQVVTIPTLAANYDDYDAELIMLEDVTFSETGTFAAGENYTLNNGSDQVAMRTNFSDVDYIGEDIPTETLDVTALAGIYNGDIQVYPRSQSDMVVVTTGITNPDGIVSMNIFPNPNNGMFTFEMNASKAGSFNVQIINIQGQVVYNKEVNQDGFYKEQIDISNEATGIYYIRINDGKDTKVSKIMIQ